MLYTRKKYLKQIKPFIGKDVIKVITGQRRVGKSYFLLQIIAELKKQGVRSENIIYINKEDREFEQIRNASDLSKHLEVKIKLADKRKKVYIFIDEVQEIQDYELSVRSFRLDRNNDIYITGSNSEIVSSELASNLSGRYIEIPLYPLDYREFLDFIRRKDSQDIFMKYMELGGLPYIQVLGLNGEQMKVYLRNVYNTIFLNDIVKRFEIRNVGLLEDLVRYLADNIGSESSANNISKYLKSQRINLSPVMIIEYIKALEAGYFIHSIKRYDIRGKKLFQRNMKYYFTDLGLRNVIENVEDDISRKLENIVCMHLLSNGFSLRVGKLNDKEIDFVANKNGRTIYVQVAYLIADKGIRDREFGNLSEIPDNYEKYVLSMDSVTEDYKGIRHMQVRDFLLNVDL